jgi:hypothetical protein
MDKCLTQFQIHHKTIDNSCTDIINSEATDEH